MVAFLLIALSIYTAMHAYLLWRVCAAFPHLGWGRWVLAGFVILMIASPVLVRMLERRWPSRIADALGDVAFLWLAVIFWFCMLLFVADGWNLLVRLAAVGIPQAKAALLPLRPVLIAIGGIIVAALCWGLAEARNVRLEHVTINVPAWDADAAPIRLVQISDLHLSGRTNPGTVERIARLIRQVQPDVLVSTGDLADSSLDAIDHLAEPLAAIRPPLGKYAVLGNHEFYLGVPESLLLHKAAGFEVLRGRSVTLAGRLRLAGVDDPAGRWRDADPMTDEDVALGQPHDNPVTVLLKHQPTVTPEMLGRYRLQLSGHTHGGQIFPFRIVTALRYKYDLGLYSLEKGSMLYVNRGTGTWGPPLRLLAPPEITVITLKAPNGMGRRDSEDAERGE
ncbi:MAG TPA: metallophosphoesterase [Phycisphaerae bacterium]|nr:metallophosphoesterase [Phycisphaerae bacterium]